VEGEEHGIMFLCEAAMGKAKEITDDDGSLVKAPAGFDSIIAKGNQVCTLWFL
jgi:poly [ADP-ribose] polymerase 2/3/4